MRANRPGRTASRTVGLLAASWLVLGLLAAPAATAEDDPEAKDAKATKPESARPRGLREQVEAVDALLKESWENASLKPSPAANDAEYMRRAYLDLLGHIPSIKEAQDFLTDKDPNKRVKLVDSLLAHPDYPKNLATLWTIVLVGRRQQERNVDRGALQSWLRVQFGSGKPWDKIAYELITATGSNKENGACNFTLSHLEMGAVPLTSITTRAFLGQQIQCTQCHDHPSNDWKQVDFWSINAFYKGIRKETVTKTDATGADVVDHLELTDEPTDAFATFDRRNAMVGIAFPTFLDGRKISQGTDVNRREELGKFITGDNIQFARAFVNRAWAHFLGRGFVNAVDDFGAHNPPNNPELLEHLAQGFKDSGYNIKELYRLICASAAYNLTSSMTKDNDKDETLFSHMALKPLTPEQLFDSLLVATAAHKAGGDNDKKRDDWIKQFQFAFATDEGEETTSFQGTIPQALMMMNGPLIEKAVSGQSGSFLSDLLILAQRQRKQMNLASYIINNLYLAALSRYPSAREAAKAREFFNTNPDSIPVMEDMFWALLNSNEFILNR